MKKRPCQHDSKSDRSSKRPFWTNGKYHLPLARLQRTYPQNTCRAGVPSKIVKHDFITIHANVLILQNKCLHLILQVITLNPLSFDLPKLLNNEELLCFTFFQPK